METLIILVGVKRLKAYRIFRNKLELLSSIVFPSGPQTPQDVRYLIRLGQTASGPLIDYTNAFHQVRAFRNTRLESLRRLITDLADRYPCGEIYLTSAQSITLALHDLLPGEVTDRIAKDYAGDFTNQPVETVIKLFKIRPSRAAGKMTLGRQRVNKGRGIPASTYLESSRKAFLSGAFQESA